MSLLPFVSVNLDNSGAVSGPAEIRYKALMLGLRDPVSPVAAHLPTRVTSAQQVASFFGQGSMLHAMARTWFANNNSTELWIIAQNPTGNGAMFRYQEYISGTATAAGTVVLYIGGSRLEVPIPSGADGPVTARALATAINRNLDLPVVAHTDCCPHQLDLYCRFEGELGNEIDFRYNYYPGEKIPPGLIFSSLSRTVRALSGGSGSPGLAPTIAAMGDTQYHFIINPYKDSANLLALKTELERRWGANLQREGVAIMAKDAPRSELIAWSSTQNSQLFVTMGTQRCPTPSFQVAAALAGVLAREAALNMGLPFHGLPLVGVLPPTEADSFKVREPEGLLAAGMSTAQLAGGNMLSIQRVVTMYRENALGAPDPSYRDLNAILILSYIRLSARTMLQRKFPRCIIGEDGVVYKSGLKVATLGGITAEFLSLFRNWQKMGLVEQAASFKETFCIERDLSNVNQINISMRPNLINQLIRTHINVQFLQ